MLILKYLINLNFQWRIYEDVLLISMFHCLTASWEDWGDLPVLIFAKMEICIPSMRFGILAPGTESPVASFSWFMLTVWTSTMICWQFVISHMSSNVKQLIIIQFCVTDMTHRSPTSVIFHFFSCNSQQCCSLNFGSLGFALCILLIQIFSCNENGRKLYLSLGDLVPGPVSST